MNLNELVLPEGSLLDLKFAEKANGEPPAVLSCLGLRCTKYPGEMRWASTGLAVSDITGYIGCFISEEVVYCLLAALALISVDLICVALCCLPLPHAQGKVLCSVSV